MKNAQRKTHWLAAAAGFLLLAGSSAVQASSHMDAPLIILDDAANTTDVYAFLSRQNGQKYLSTALAVYPFEEPGIGPNKYNFSDDVSPPARISRRGARRTATSSGSRPGSGTARPSCSRTSASSTTWATPPRI